MNELIKARVIEIHRQKYIISIESGERSAVLSGRLMYSDEYPVVGDRVLAVDNGESSDAVIVSIEPRKSLIKRPDRHGHADGYVRTMLEQVMVANIDYLFIITSLNDNFNVNRIARYASIALSGGCTPVAILTKADICSEREQRVSEVRDINRELRVHCVSSYTGEGLDEIRAYLKKDVCIALMGSSGVGKSTLINTLAGEKIMLVSEIREEDSKGRHTTTHRQMLKIGEAYVIDTPGMRELGMCDVEEGINENFADITAIISRCRFDNCSHNGEPGCAVAAALDSGELSPGRWKLFAFLHEESDRAKSKKSAKMLEIAKAKQNLKKQQKLGLRK